MTEDFIKLNKRDVLRLEIRTEDGKDTGNYLEFDLEDIELPLRYQELVEMDKKNKINLQNQLHIIEKREDVKGKKLLSRNEEDKIKALNEFFNKEIEVYNLFLGENGVQKLLNGAKMSWTALAEIDDIVEKQIAPKLDLKLENITERIKNKYGEKLKEKEVLK